MNYLFESERLGFRAWSAEDLPRMAAINADPEVMRFFPATVTEQQTQDFITRMQVMFQEKGYCYYAVDEKAGGNLIGFIGLFWQTYEAPFTPATDIGWRLAKKFWGKGYATEGAARCLRHAFDELRLDRVVATAPSVNQPSVHVMEKIGLQKLGEFIHPRLAGNPRLEHCVYYGLSHNK